MSGSLGALTAGGVALATSGSAVAQIADLVSLVGAVQDRPLFRGRVIHTVAVSGIVAGTTYLTNYLPLEELREILLFCALVGTAPTAAPTAFQLQFQIFNPAINGGTSWIAHPDDAGQVITPGIVPGSFGVKRFTNFGPLGLVAFKATTTSWTGGDATTKLYISYMGKS